MGTTVYDLALAGGTDSTGTLNEVFNNDAISNALKMWFSSFEGEIVRAPYLGGMLIPTLTKPMSEESQEDLYDDIFSGLKNDFFPSMTVNTLEVTPDYTKRQWNIFLQVYSPDYKDMVEVNIVIKNLV